jgi:hypothetical protein
MNRDGLQPIVGKLPKTQKRFGKRENVSNDWSGSYVDSL